MDGDFGLGEDWTVVVDFVDEVDGDACGLASGVEDGLVDVVAVHASSAEIREQGGVGVDDAVTETLQGDWAEEFHVAGQNDKVDVVAGEGVGDGGVEGLGFGVGAAAQVEGGDVVIASPLEGYRLRVVADDHTAAGVEVALFAGVDDGLESGAGVRREDAEVE